MGRFAMAFELFFYFGYEFSILREICWLNAKRL